MTAWIIAAILAGLCLVGFVILRVTGPTGRLPANPLFGLRTPRVFRTQEGWVAGHHAARHELTVACVFAALSLFGAVIGMRSGADWGEWVFLGSLVGMALVSIAGTIKADRVAGTVLAAAEAAEGNNK